MLVVLATMVVMSVMVVMLKVAMTYFATCQFTGTWWMHLQEGPPSGYYCGFLFLPQVFAHSVYSYFSATSFGLMSIPSHKNLSYYVSVPLSIWQLNRLDLCHNLICISIFSYTIFSRSMLCREASIMIKSGLLSHSINQRLSDKVIYWAVLYTCLPIVYPWVPVLGEGANFEQNTF